MKRRHGGLLLAAALLLAPAPGAQSPQRATAAPRSWSPALDFLRPYGLQNFSPHYVGALEAFLRADRHVLTGEYADAASALQRLWSLHPTGGLDWGALPTQPFGLNLGSPTGYYGLRMLSDIVDWRLSSGFIGSTAPHTARLTVLVVGHTQGIEPRTAQELAQGTGIPVVHDLDPGVPADGYHSVHQSLRLFREYVLAATQGQLALETHLLELPGLTLPVHAELLSSGLRFAGLTSTAPIWAAVSDAERKATDWWWILYPSHVPEQYPDFASAEFITGGMGTGPDGGSPLFIIDDRWLVRKPPHLGSGPYSDVERRAYLPQWLQHEFFHHLFRTYPQFGLEQTPHQWFDRGSWPPDFEGRYEADYYHEALVRRLASADPPLHVALRYATSDAPWDQLTLDDVLGTYHRLPIENPWHIGTLHVTGTGQLRWTNTAPFGWNLSPDLAAGVLNTGPDCPYYAPPNGTEFNLVLERDAQGDLIPVVAGFRFDGQLYVKQ